MRAARLNRKISAYAIHAHGKDFSGDYEELFSVISSMEKSDRIIKIRDVVVAITNVSRVADGYFLTFVEGEEGVQPLILDTVTGETRDGDLERDEALGAAAHALVKPNGRRILIEYVKRGAKAEVMARTVEELLRSKRGKDFRIEFSPLVEEDFVREINRFTRIRMASITMIKPNAGWDDHYTKISKLLEESDGEKADLSVRAARGETLSKTAGIVEIIKDVVTDEQPYVSDAEIVGMKDGEEGETSLPLHKHVVSKVVNVPREVNGGVNVLRLRQKMISLMGSLF